MKESDIQKAICDYLTLKRYFFWRQNTIPPVQKVNGKMKFRRMPKYSMNGVPDIILIRDGQFWGIEVKGRKGTVSDNQIEFMKGCTKAGGYYHVVRSLDEVKDLGL